MAAPCGRGSFHCKRDGCLPCHINLRALAERAHRRWYRDDSAWRGEHPRQTMHYYMDAYIRPPRSQPAEAAYLSDEFLALVTETRARVDDVMRRFEEEDRLNGVAPHTEEVKETPPPAPPAPATPFLDEEELQRLTARLSVHRPYRPSTLEDQLPKKKE